jgi:TM2 domain-containing membrane protein YozV
MSENTTPGAPQGVPPTPEPAPQPQYQPQPDPQYVPQPQYQYAPQGQQMYPGAKPTRYRKERIVAGILALTFGMVGAHKFYLGYTTEAIIMIVILVVGSCLAVGPLVATVIAIIEGITYLLKSDEEWERIYVYGKKGWF